MESPLAAAKYDAGHTERDRITLAQRVDRVRDALDSVDAMIGAIRSDLEPVLRPSVPTPAGELAGAPQDGDSSWLADTLDGITARLADLYGQLTRLQQRIDL